MKDENQIAFSILHTLTNTEPRPGESPLQRAQRAYGMDFAPHASKGGQASVAQVPPEQRRANGLKGAITRWGPIKPRDNSTMPASRKNLDVNQLAKRILDEAIGDEPKTEAPAQQPKNKAAVALGKLGGKKGGAARAAKLTAEQRSAIAKKAATERWSNEAKKSSEAEAAGQGPKKKISIVPLDPN